MELAVFNTVPAARNQIARKTSSKKHTSTRRKFISTGLKRQIVSTYSIGAKFLGHPFEYDKDSGRCRRVRGNWIYVWYGNNALAHSHWAFLWIRTVETCFVKEEKLETKLFMIVMTGIVSLTIACQHIVHRHGDDVTMLFNTGIEFFDRFGKRYEKGGNIKRLKKITVLIVLAMKSWVYSCSIVVPLAGLYVFANPTLPIYPTSMMDLSCSKNLLLIQAASVVYFVYTFYIMLAGVFMVASNCLTFGFLIAMALGSIGKNNAESTRTKLTEDQDLKWYKEIELLQIMFNNAFSPSFLPVVDVMWVCMVIAGILAAVRASGMIAFITVFNAVCAMGLLVITFRPLANIFINSSQILECWRNHSVTAAERRVTASLRPVTALVGSYFYVDPMLVLTIVNIIVINSISVLLLEG